jgi:tRNA 2-selenouridine synthase
LTALNHTFATLDERASFDTIIDARSESEFAEDHVPGAINCPVLNDHERIVVGTLYKQESPFAARKVGAALVARNVARHLDTYFSDKPKSWKPLVYCWRGGQRSGSLTHILREVGWPAKRLQGGYKSWRHFVLEHLQTVPLQFTYEVIAGPTGSAKTRILEALQQQGYQVLNLEGLAAHKGSVLGVLPDHPQPSQKMFETQLLETLRHFSPQQPVFVESESRTIGKLRLPSAVFEGIQNGRWLHVEAERAQRVAFLLTDYAYFLHGAELPRYLDRLKELCGRERVEQWKQLAGSGHHAELVESLLTQHYDLHYQRSMRRGDAIDQRLRKVVAGDLSAAGIEDLARIIGELGGSHIHPAP